MRPGTRQLRMGQFQGGEEVRTGTIWIRLGQYKGVEEMKTGTASVPQTGTIPRV